MENFKPLVALLATVILYACSASDQNVELLSLDDLPEIQLSEVQTISETDDLLFQRLSNAFTTSDGYVIFSVNTTDLHSFSADGEHIQQITRQGNGPGEIGRSMNISMDNDDNIIIASNFNAMFFDYQGDGKWSYDRTVTLGPAASGFPGQVFPSTDKGAFLVEYSTLPPENGMQDYVKIVSLFDEEGTLLADSVATESSKGHALSELPFGTLGMPVPFAPIDEININRSGEIYAGFSDSFSFSVLNNDGNEIRSFSHPHLEPHAISSAEKEDVITTYHIQNKNDIMPLIPDHTKAYERFLVSNNHKLLLNIYSEEGNAWILLDEEKGVLGRLILEDNISIIGFDNNRLGKRVTKEDGTLEFKLYELI